jgi:hypothetical protein
MLQVFHKDLGIPPVLLRDTPRKVLRYSRHALKAAQDEGLASTSLPSRLPENVTIIEVEADSLTPTKWVYRFPLTGTARDLVLVVTVDGFVKTLWTNDVNDSHRTLDTSKYARM